MSEGRGDRFLSILLSIMVHAAIVGALFWGWWQYRAAKPVPQTLAIEATVVHNGGGAAEAAPAPTPPPPEPIAPPPPAPDEAQLQREQAANAAAKAEAERKAALEAQARAEADAAAKAQAKAEAEAQAAAEARVKAEAEAKAQADAAAKAKADAEAAAKAKAEAERKAQELAQQRKADAERAQREADLRSQLQSEEHLDAARTNGAMAQYQALIAAKIERAWIRPPSAHAGISCQVNITQVPGGAVTAVSVGHCNGDDAVRQSIENAAYSASPLPAPSDPALFDRDVVVTFSPHD